MTKFFSLLLIFIFIKFNFVFADSLVNLSEASWNDIDSMTGQFKQIDHDGNIQYGNFYIQKPHRSLFEYKGQEEKILTSLEIIPFLGREDGFIFTAATSFL